MFSYELVSYHAGAVAIRAVRDAVFVHEQGVDPELEHDEQDALARHIVVWAGDIPVATGRLLNDGHIGRVSVLKQYRGHRLGIQVMDALIAEARVRGCSRVFLGAQKQATGFYRKLGFTPCGDEFMEAGIAHIEMEKRL